MSNTKTLQHKLNILKLLYDTNLKITASQLKISNANQYFNQLEEMGLIKRLEISRVGISSFKVGFVDQDTKEKAKEYLDKHGKLNSITPLHIINFKYVEDNEVKRAN